jgi:hypothetical protein
MKTDSPLQESVAELMTHLRSLDLSAKRSDPLRERLREGLRDTLRDTVRERF